jgi:membrane-bound metal-dependent hydrolase YbcI (DUF457 family)
MAFAASHILSTVVVIDFFRQKFPKLKKKIPLHFVYIAGFFSIIPDLDFVAYWVFGLFTDIHFGHKFISHSVLVPMIMLVFALFLYRIKSKWGCLALLCSFSYAGHIFLDYLVSWKYAYLWPFLSVEIGFPLIPEFFKNWFWWAALDAFILVAWLLLALKYNRIKDFV